MKEVIFVSIALLSAFTFGIYMHDKSTKDATHLIYYDGSQYYVKDNNILLENGCITYTPLNQNMTITKCGNFTVHKIK